MDLERQQADRPAGLPLPAKVAIGAITLWVAFSALSWVISSALSLIRFGLFVVIVIALFGWAVSAKGSR